MTSIIIEQIDTSVDISSFYENYKNDKGDSGFDLYCPVDVVIPPLSFSNKIGMGVKVQMTTSYNAVVGYMLVPRSSIGSKTSLRLSNSIGIIDSGYTGEIIACFDNFSTIEYSIKKGDRLVQIVPFDGRGVYEINMGYVSETSRGESGFGSTGK